MLRYTTCLLIRTDTLSIMIPRINMASCNGGTPAKLTLRTCGFLFSPQLRSDIRCSSTNAGFHLPRLSETFKKQVLSSSLPLCLQLHHRCSSFKNYTIKTYFVKYLLAVIRCFKKFYLIFIFICSFQ